jgi:F0F1-type ATP synthase epsilon subunit
MPEENDKNAIKPDSAKGTKDINESEVSVDDGDKAPDGLMKIKVYSPFKEYFNGAGKSISAVNDTGPFDVLAGHHKFLTLLNRCEIEIRDDQGSEKIKIDRGIMYVKADRVTVFLDV